MATTTPASAGEAETRFDGVVEAVLGEPATTLRRSMATD
jgi:hypothetical protein